MRVRIDLDACQGHSRCALMYPEIFDVDDDGKAFVHVGNIPPEWKDKALMAIANCPERAISMDEGMLSSSTEDSPASAEASSTTVSALGVPRARRANCRREVELGTLVPKRTTRLGATRKPKFFDQGGGDSQSRAALAGVRTQSAREKGKERMSSDRVELHLRLARGKWEAYANALDTGVVKYPDEWIYNPDAVIMCPRFNNGKPNRFADLATDELLPLLAALPDGDILTPEIRMWWKHMPDWRLVSPFDCVAAEWGFAVKDTYAGTTSDGRVLSLDEWDYIWTNEEGQITRWDWFVDSSEWNPYLELIGLDPNGLTYQGYVANYLRVDGKG